MPSSVLFLAAETWPLAGLDDERTRQDRHVRPILPRALGLRVRYPALLTTMALQPY